MKPIRFCPGCGNPLALAAAQLRLDCPGCGAGLSLASYADREGLVVVATLRFRVEEAVTPAATAAA